MLALRMVSSTTPLIMEIAGVTDEPDTSAVNSVFVTANILYASTANGNVFYSTDNGNTWNCFSPPGWKCR